ncbi:MAG TPA: MgtC/SapB family protein [Solirubrobacteraceae bacterium]|nr:MgtC/SapB family protein [Solirubrobacteraceae bacterium]
MGKLVGMPGDPELVLRIAAAAALGALLGLEREHSGQPAGMRTHALVACGAAIFTLAGAYGFSDVHRGPNVDPMRVAAQVASGIGFIGGGVILKEGASVRGVTTAASLWAAAAIGLAVGAGLVVEAAASVVVILVMLVGLRHARDALAPRLGAALRVVVVQYERGHGTLGPLLDALRAAGAHVEDLWIDDRAPAGDDTRAVRVLVRTARLDSLQRAVAEIGRLREVHAAHLGTAPS